MASSCRRSMSFSRFSGHLTSSPPVIQGINAPFVAARYIWLPLPRAQAFFSARVVCPAACCKAGTYPIPLATARPSTASEQPTHFLTRPQSLDIPQRRFAKKAGIFPVELGRALITYPQAGGGRIQLLVQHQLAGLKQPHLL